MIQSKRGLLLAAVVTVMAGLVLTFPARIAYQWASPPDLALSGLHGTVWSGKADAAMAKGVYLEDLSWRIKPLKLFTGKAMYHVAATPVSGFVEADLGLGIGGTLTLENLAASLPLQLLAGPLNMRGLQGSASFQFERIALKGDLPVAADGSLEVRGLLAPRISREPIGGYRVEFFSEDDGIGASVEDTDGVVDIAGSLKINSDRAYRFIAQVIAKPDAPDRLKTQMQYLPPANDRGQQELRIEGNF